MAANERVSCWRRPGVVSLGIRMVTSIPALAMSIPAARSANSGSSSTSCIGSSYDENAVTGVAVRGSCGQPEIWSAGSKHHVTALKDSSQRSDFAAGSSPPKDNDVSGRPHPHPGNRHRPGAASSPTSRRRPAQASAPAGSHTGHRRAISAAANPRPQRRPSLANFHAVTASPGPPTTLLRSFESTLRQRVASSPRPAKSRGCCRLGRTGRGGWWPG